MNELLSTPTLTPRPLPLRDWQIRALDAGRLTQVRILAKPPTNARFLPADHWQIDIDEPGTAYLDDGSGRLRIVCPKGEPGQRFFIQETYGIDTDGQCQFVRYRSDLGFGPDCSDRISHDEAVARGTPWNGFDWRPSTTMPAWASRFSRTLANVRVERVQDISEGDAIAAGFGRESCGPIFRKAAGRARQDFARWLELSDRSEPEGYWCLGCVNKKAAKCGATVCGWNDCFETDHAPYCNACGTLLYHSLTNYGVRSELGFCEEDGWWQQATPFGGSEALVLAELAEGMGDWSDEYAGRLAQIAFGTNWESIHGPGAWARNDWVWVLELGGDEGGKGVKT